MNDLKPCPFCDAAAEIERQGTARASMIIACTNCGCRLESGDVCGMTSPEHYAWNHRPAEVTMNYLLSVLDKATIAKGGVMTWQDGLQAIRKVCNITHKEVA